MVLFRKSFGCLLEINVFILFLKQVFTVKSRGSAPVTLASLRETSKETFQYFGRLVLAVKSKLITSVSKIEIIREKNGANFSENCQTAIRCSGVESLEICGGAGRGNEKRGILQNCRGNSRENLSKLS